jgi:hypothetical protein
LRNKREQTGKINVCIGKTEPSYDNNKYLLHWLKSGVEEQQRRVKTSNEKKLGIMNESSKMHVKAAVFIALYLIRSRLCCWFVVQTDVIFNVNIS